MLKEGIPRDYLMFSDATIEFNKDSTTPVLNIRDPLFDNTKDYNIDNFLVYLDSEINNSDVFLTNTDTKRKNLINAKITENLEFFSEFIGQLVNNLNSVESDLVNLDFETIFRNENHLESNFLEIEEISELTNAFKTLNTALTKRFSNRTASNIQKQALSEEKKLVLTVSL